MIQALVYAAVIPLWLASAAGAVAWWGLHYVVGNFR